MVLLKSWISMTSSNKINKYSLGSNNRSWYLSFYWRWNTWWCFFRKTRAPMQHNQKRARKSSKRAQLWIFIPPFFPQIWAFRTLYSPKGHVFLEFTLCAATARNKWLEKTLGVAPINHRYAKLNAHLSDDYDPSIWIHPWIHCLFRCQQFIWVGDEPIITNW